MYNILHPQEVMTIHKPRRLLRELPIITASDDHHKISVKVFPEHGEHWTRKEEVGAPRGV